MKVKNARLCIDCDNVFHSKYSACPHCASPIWIPLSVIVPSLRGGDEVEQTARASYRPDHTKPERVPEDPPRPFFARLKAWVV